MKNQERDMMRKIILIMIKKGHVHWTDLKKMVLGSCYPFATDSTFIHQIRYLLEKGYIERVTRGVYRITPQGEKYLDIL